MNRRFVHPLCLLLAASVPPARAVPLFEDEVAPPVLERSFSLRPESLFEEPAAPAQPPLPTKPPVITAPPAGGAAPIAPQELSVPRSVVKKDPVFETPPDETVVAPVAEPQLTVPELLRLGRYHQVAALAANNRDGNLAEAIAWRYYEDLDFDRAERWFAQAIKWGNPSSELYYGLALIYFATGDDAKAEAITRRYQAEDMRLRNMQGDILVRRAIASGDPATTADTLREAAKYRYLSKAEEITLAWSDLKAGRTKQAADLFEALYKVYRDDETAAGLESSLGSTGERSRLAQIATDAPGPLENPVTAAQIVSPGVTYYNRGLYGAAVQADPKTYANLRPVIAPSISIGTRVSSKSGTDGLSQLTTVELPTITARITAYSRHDLEARISRVSIESGSVPAGTPVGNAPVLPVPPPAIPAPLPRQPARDIDDYEWNLRYRYQGLWSPFIGVSQPANSGLIGNRFDWEIGIQRFHTSGYLQARLFSQAVRDSFLSLDGLRDPYGPSVWGRVKENGLTVSAYQQLNERDSFYTQLTAGQLSGKDVADNEHVGFRASLSRSFPLSNGSSLFLGPGISLEHYQRNLSHFTLGHGGYFSPNYMIQGDFGGQFSTKEGRPWLFSASGLLGYQRNQQSGSPYFPLAPDGRDHPGSEAADITYSLAAKAGMLIDSNWIVGGGFSINSAADYDDFSLGIFLRYVFDNRTGLMAGDLVW
jgi:cellulose synthase operon protein C